MPMDTHLLKQDELLSVLESAFYAIVRVNPEEDACWFLKGVREAHCFQRLAYKSLLQKLGRFVYAKYRRQVLYKLSPAVLARRDFKPDYSLNFAYATFGEERWVSLSFVCDPQSHSVYLLFRQCGEYDVVLKDIVNLYVYDRCDYFVYIDALKNSYVMFSGSQDSTPIPPLTGDDYNGEVVRYAQRYVPPEERDVAISEMVTDRVIEALEHSDTHSAYVGVVDPVRGYTRKKVEFQYYDRERKKLLLWRTDISELYHDELERNARLREALHRAQTDSMTGLLNKQTFEEEVREWLQTSRELAAFLFVDLDNFKTINDVYGHSAGDRAILALASLLKRETKDCHALVGRIGGDEFAVFLPRLHTREEADRFARAVCAGFAAQGRQLGSSVSCSIGIACYPDEAASYEELTEKADSRVYMVKSSGKNGVLSD